MLLVRPWIFGLSLDTHDGFGGGGYKRKKKKKDELIQSGVGYLRTINVPDKFLDLKGIIKEQNALEEMEEFILHLLMDDDG